MFRQAPAPQPAFPPEKQHQCTESVLAKQREGLVLQPQHLVWERFNSFIPCSRWAGGDTEYRVLPH